VFAERAAKTEALRRLPDETFADLAAPGLFRITQPRRFGGSELGLVDAFGSSTSFPRVRVHRVDVCAAHLARVVPAAIPRQDAARGKRCPESVGRLARRMLAR
jgi:alkylation response protein AidB-like acyl-CoA dehydrogenase